jgi:hypothetical protein
VIKEEDAMTADYAVVIHERRHFGENENRFPGVFVGNNEDFPFDCPGIDADQRAVLMFQSLSIDHAENALEVNGSIVYGGLPVSRSNEDWTGNIMLIEPNVLRSTGNMLHVGSRNARGGLLGTIDEFVIDNVVVMYKRHGRWTFRPDVKRFVQALRRRRRG